MARHLRLCAFTVGLFIFSVQAADNCFADAVASDRRKNVEQTDESYPLGIWLNNWAAGHATGELVKILLEEKLGYNVTFTGVGPGTVDGFYALAGCAAPLDMENRRCGGLRTYSHINVEGWTNTYKLEWDELQEAYPATAPKNLGNMGYHGAVSAFVPRASLVEGLRTEGLALEFFRSYDATWQQPWRYFGDIADIDKNEIQMCNETRFMSDVLAERYLNLTGDSPGVFVRNETTGVMAAYCPDGYFWLSPSCRANQSRCIVHVTGGAGWSVDETMQKAALWNMPVAVAVAKDWSSLPRRIRGMFFWWVPDPTFLELQPQEILFPPYDAQAWGAGDKSTAPDAVSIDVLVSRDLAVVAPAAQDFLTKFRLEMKDVNWILLEQKRTQDSWRNVTCRWLLENEEIWTEWVPDRTQCFPGFGLYDTQQDRFVESRASTVGLVCQACRGGSYSKQLMDSAGSTYICKACEAGRSQALGAEISCDPCEIGMSQPMEGQISCERCGKGKYQDEIGQSQCKTCDGSTTLGFGSVAMSDCGCEVGYIKPDNNGTCQACGEGLDCPFHASVSTLLSGVSDVSEELESPKLKSGYFSTLEQPERIFKCARESHCAGGRPGTCSGGRVGVPCALCPDGHHAATGGCVKCEDWRMLAWGAGMFGGLVFITSAYYLLTSTTTAKASIMLATTGSFGMFINSLQVAGIIGLITVQWPEALNDIFGILQVLLFDLDNFGFSCVAGSSPTVRYVVSCVMFPALVLYVATCYFISRVQPKIRLRWEPAKVLSTIGQFLQVGYSPMCTIALAPFMCYLHPSGLRSVLKYPSILCGTDEHGAMLIAGNLLLVFFVLGFLALCCYLAYKLPAWSIAGKAHRVRSARFLVFRFRLDRWWFGVALLVKGPLMSLPVVLATDHPPVQTTFIQIFILLYLVLQVVTWPWKTPVLNVIDAWIGVCLLMLINSASLLVEDLGTDMQGFVDLANTGTVVCLGFALTFLLGMVCLALFFRQTMGSIKELRILTLGAVPEPSAVTDEFTLASGKLMAMSRDQLVHKMEGLSVYDLQMMVRCLTVIHVELLPRYAVDRGRLSVRPVSSSINLSQRITMREEATWDPQTQRQTRKLTEESVEAEAGVDDKGADPEPEETNAIQQEADNEPSDTASSPELQGPDGSSAAAFSV